MKNRLLPALLLACAAALPGNAQSATTAQTAATTPLWVKDLRRAEIVAFGAFPFAMFFTSISVDTYRYATHGWNPLYAPWPLKPAGAVIMTQDELKNTLTIAAGLAVAVSIADYFIVRNKRQKQARLLDHVPGETPITTRRPWPEADQSLQSE